MMVGLRDLQKNSFHIDDDDEEEEEVEEEDERGVL